LFPKKPLRFLLKISPAGGSNSFLGSFFFAGSLAGSGFESAVLVVVTGLTGAGESLSESLPEEPLPDEV
jgi:hypothetical protein